MTGGEEGQGEDSVEWLTDRVGQRHRFGQLGQTPVEVAEEEVAPSGEDVGGHALVGSESVAEDEVALGVVRGERPVGQCQRLRHAPLEAAGQTQLHSTEHLEEAVAAGFGDRQDSLGQLGPEGDVAVVEVVDGEPAEGLADAFVIADEFAQLAGPLVGHGQRRIGVAVGCDGGSESELQLDLEFETLVPVGQLAGKLDRPREEGDGLPVTRPFGGDPRRSPVVHRRLLQDPGRLVVPGHHLGRRRWAGRLPGIELPGHPLVDGAAVAAEE